MSLSRFGGRATETSFDTGVDAAAGCADKRKAHELSRPVLSDLLQEGARQLQRLARLSPGQRGAVAKPSLIRLRKQKLLRQVFERLQDRLLCTFLKVD